MENNAVRKGFHGVYLLHCMNPRYRGHTYIGYTVDPARRIRQHNGGVDKGGAHKTSRKKPWEMILIVHGFPNDVIALQFEWAWQNPQRTRRLKNVPCTKSKRTKESNVAFAFRILSELLRVGPWNRLPLTIRWLIQSYQIEFDPCCQPPLHMPVAYGPLTTDKPKKRKEREDDDLNIPAYQSKRCAQCSAKFKGEESTVHCPKPDCTMIAHTVCLAKAFIRHSHEDGIFCIPVYGKCPGCQEEVFWRELVKPLGIVKQDDDIDNDEPHWTHQLRQ